MLYIASCELSNKKVREEKMGKTIMTVDDSNSMRELVGITLQSAGYEVVKAVDGVDALEKAEKSSFDMVLTDLNMPNMDGIELIQKLREHSKYRFKPILMLTTESQESKKKEGKAAGATGWIVKPFKPNQLVAVVKKVMG